MQRPRPDHLVFIVVRPRDGGRGGGTIRSYYACHSQRLVILAVESGYRESTESWAAILRDLTRRGLAAPKVVIGDGHLGIWGALAAVFPEAKEQRCWNHRVPGRARSKDVRRPPAGKTFTPASQRQVVAA